MTPATRLLPPDNREHSIDSLARLLAHYLPGKAIQVTVEPQKRKRSNDQLAALFGVAYKSLMAQMGLRGERERQQLHEAFCGEYWGWRDVVILNNALRVPVRTTTTDPDGRRDPISTVEMMDFYAFIQQRAAEYGYDVADPNPEWFRRAERDAEIDREAAR